MGFYPVDNITFSSSLTLHAVHICAPDMICLTTLSLKAQVYLRYVLQLPSKSFVTISLQCYTDIAACDVGNRLMP